MHADAPSPVGFFVRTRAREMSPKTITIASKIAGEDVQARWGRPIAEAWPNGGVRCSTISLTDLHTRLALEPAELGTVLLLVDETTTNAELAQFVDTIERTLVPAVVLLPGGVHRSLGAGLITETHDADPRRLAAILYALDRRQQTVANLALELGVAQRSHSGVSGEMSKLQEELSLAASVQRDFLPRQMPAVAGLDFGILFRPVGYVSGDIYDFQVLDINHVAFFIADVVGHGMPAALLTMALCRGINPREQTDSGLKIAEPVDVLSRLNQELAARQQSGQRFATAIYGVIDARTRRVTISGAGHPPPLLVSRNSIEQIDASGPLLGVFPDAEFDQSSFTLAHDEILILYTDGIETAFPAGNTPTDRMRRPNRNYRDHLAAAARHRIEHAADMDATMEFMAAQLDQQSGSLHNVDDITTMVIAPSLAAAARAAA